MGNFEKLSVLVIVVIIVMILVVAIYTWTDNPDQSATTGTPPEKFARGGKEPGGLGGPITDEPRNPWGPIFDDEKDKEGLEPIRKTPSIGTPIDEDKPEPPVKPGPGKTPEKKDEPATDAPDEPWMYTVKSGDTLSEIAMRELGTMRRQNEIMALNPGLDPSRLRVGQQIKMPPKGAVGPGPVHSDDGGAETPSGSGRPVPGEYYVTRPGDTLERISKLAYETIEYWPDLWSRNLSVLNGPKDVVPGMKIFIPKIK